jgi:putative ABC transport system permease protein
LDLQIFHNGRESSFLSKYDEYTIMKSAMTNTAEMAYQIFTRRESIKYESKTVSDVKSPCFKNFIDIQGLEFEKGRFYNESEANSGAVTALSVMKLLSLFEGSDPIGKYQDVWMFYCDRRVEERRFRLFGDSIRSAFIPVNFVRQLYGDNNTS